MNFAIPADDIVKIKESEKMEKYLHLAKKLKNLWNIKVTVMPIVFNAFGMVSKYLEKKLEIKRSETIQTTLC